MKIRVAASRLFNVLPYCGVIILIVYGLSILSRETTELVVTLARLDGPQTVIAASGAELVARICATGVVLWKIAAVFAEADKVKELVTLVRERTVLFAFALFATLYMALDRKMFLWAQYLTGGLSEYGFLQLATYQASFTALMVNIVTLVLLNFKTWKGAAWGLVTLTGLSAFGFFSALGLQVMT